MRLPSTVCLVVALLAACSATPDEGAASTQGPPETSPTTVEEPSESSAPPTTQPETSVSTYPPFESIEQWEATSTGRLVASRAPGTQLQEALTEMSLVLGPIPGTLPIEPDPGVPLSITHSIMHVLANWDELSAEQQTAVTGYLDRPSETRAPVGVLAGLPRSPLLAGVTTVELEGMFEDAETVVRSRLGGEDLDWSVEVIEPIGTIGAQTQPGSWSMPGLTLEAILRSIGSDAELPVTDCTIYVVRTQMTADLATLISTTRHEMFHCWSLENADSLASHIRTPVWWQEGGAAWVGETEAGGSSWGAAWWPAYMRPFHFALYWSSYDAIGFWSWLDGRGSSSYDRLRNSFSIAQTGSHTRLLEFLTADVVSQLDGLAGGRLREPSWGSAWDMSGPGIGTHRFIPHLEPHEAAHLDARFGEWSVGYFAEIDQEPEHVYAVTFETDGYLWRVRWDDGSELSGSGPTTMGWCLTEPCECPDGTAIEGDFSDPVPGRGNTAIALTGASVDASESIGLTYHDLDCTDEEEEPAPEPPDPTDAGPLNGTWIATDAAVQAFLDTIIPDQPGLENPEYELVGGEWSLTFSGTTSSSDVNLDILIVAPSSIGPPISFPMRLYGGGTFTHAREGNRLVLYSDDYSITGELAGSPLTIDTDDFGPGGREYRWEIDEDILRLTASEDGVIGPNRWRRSR